MTGSVTGAATSRLRGSGQRLTAHRRSLVDILASARRPLTIPEIVRDRPDLAQSSVYRNLVVLQQAGVVRRVVTGTDFARYELDETLTDHHHHVVCTSCGAVEDLILPKDVEATIGRIARRAAGRHGFVEAGHRLDVTGLCGDCR
jgi:Fe2+ or Zn2+ uptake regulation protein